MFVLVYRQRLIVMRVPAARKVRPERPHRPLEQASWALLCHHVPYVVEVGESGGARRLREPERGEPGLEVPAEENVIWHVPADADAKWPLPKAVGPWEWMFEL